MKEFLAGAGLVLILVLVVIIIIFFMKKTEKRERRGKRGERLYSDNRDLIGYYVGHSNVPSPRVVAPLRPNVYIVPNTPVITKRPRRVRRLFL
jgi:hypothetical protein